MNDPQRQIELNCRHNPNLCNNDDVPNDNQFDIIFNIKTHTIFNTQYY